jgi:hypothetical protein
MVLKNTIEPLPTKVWKTELKFGGFRGKGGDKG